jgi:hypothetical protein
LSGGPGGASLTRHPSQSPSSGRSRPDAVISVCHPSHISTWSLVAPRILAALAPRSAVVIVPDEARAAFVRASPGEFQVECDSEHASAFGGRLRGCLAAVGTDRRYGWYLQQFLKLSALRAMPADRRAIIWDADTLPLRPLRFFDADGAPRFYTGSESHGPYFTTTRALLGYGKQTTRSFVAQSLPVVTDWAHEFFDHLEEDGRSWSDRILDVIEPRIPSSFSEYETLGSFFLRRHPDEMRWQTGAWIRGGYRAFGGPESAPWSDDEGPGPDFAAFEAWERGPKRRGNRGS